MNEDIVIPGMFFLTVIVLAIGVPLVRARIKAMEQGTLLPSRDPMLDERLTRIEQAIDAVAVEMERVSEGQRFMTRLMADSPAAPAALPRQAPSSHDQR